MKTRILYIENHPVFAASAQDVFLSDCEITVAPDMASVLAALESQRFDLALVDFDLDDCKGDEVTRVIRERFPQLKIIAASSHAQGNAKIQKAGADAVCGKMEFSKIREIIEQVLERPI
ncbi:probable two-component response regulator [Hahella chejuensis KCTC 2396]|uniref:Probable two-component response regulator n=1 Tax=Hahella chejuensis (strain KCTC 2396) TaxID=349521 RepID=Q2SMV4_HAHCH|nr:response regulator [Hahella chejuensis]ABC28020.1 probable two-component response regulator [Hahella chejuensis KCTC 2396]